MSIVLFLLHHVDLVTLQGWKPWAKPSLFQNNFRTAVEAIITWHAHCFESWPFRTEEFGFPQTPSRGPEQQITSVQSVETYFWVARERRTHPTSSSATWLAQLSSDLIKIWAKARVIQATHWPRREIRTRLYFRALQTKLDFSHFKEFHIRLTVLLIRTNPAEPHGHLLSLEFTQRDEPPLLYTAQPRSQKSRGNFTLGLWIKTMFFLLDTEQL